MIGKYIIHEGIWKYRLDASKVVGETAAYWKVEKLHGVDKGEARRITKRTKIYAMPDNEKSALQIRDGMNTKLKIEQDRHKEAIKEIFEGYAHTLPTEEDPEASSSESS